MRIRRSHGAARPRAGTPRAGAGDPRPFGVRTVPGRLALVVILALLATFEVPETPRAVRLATGGWPGSHEYVKTTVAYVDATVPADRLHLDLYRPTAAERLGPYPPVIVYLHGGGWFQGVRSELAAPGASVGKAILAQLRRGWVIASVDYTSTFTRPFPQAVLDVKRAIRHLRANGFGASRVVVAGSSAGGHLAVMVAVTAGVDRYEPVGDGLTAPTRVDGAVSLDGPLELRALLRDPWRTQSWYPANEPDSAVTDRFGPTLESGELVPAFLGCADARLVSSPSPRLSEACDALVEAGVDDASPRRWADAGDPPLYLVCNTANLLLPDCAHDNRPFAVDYVARHGGTSASAWVDELEQSRRDPAVAHFTVDQHVDLDQLEAFLDRA